jgi:hypothetical protein
MAAAADSSAFLFFSFCCAAWAKLIAVVIPVVAKPAPVATVAKSHAIIIMFLLFFKYSYHS